MTWPLGVRIVIMALALRRLGLDGALVLRRELPPTRIMLPALVFLAALLVANHLIPRPVAVSGMFVVDLALMAACFMLARSLRVSPTAKQYQEDRLQHAFERFFPRMLAKVAAVEFTVYAHIVTGLRGVIDPPRVSCATYVNGSKLMMLGIILTLSIVPDAFLLWLLLPHRLWWLAAILDVLEVWGCGWLFGLYGTMIARPHEIDGDRIVFHNGVLTRSEVLRADIAGTRILGVVKRRGFGAPIVELQLREGKRLLVASDAPAALIKQIS